MRGCVVAVAAVRVRAIAVALNLRGRRALEARRASIKLSDLLVQCSREQAMSVKWSGVTYASSSASPYPVGQSVLIGRSSHQNCCLDLSDSASRELDCGICIPLVRVTASAEGNVKYLGTLFHFL